MSLFSIFDIGKTALLTSQAALDVISHNIANVNTPGYSRQEIVLESQPPVKTSIGYIGRGVMARQVKRYYDGFLQRQILNQQQLIGRSSVLSSIYKQLESIFNEQTGSGFTTAYSEYLNAWQEVADNPDSKPQRTVLLSKAQTLVSRAKSMERAMTQLVSDIHTDVSNTVKKINQIAKEIANLNDKIAQVEAGSYLKANDLRDKRDNLMKELAGLVGYTYFEDSSGKVTIIVGRKNLVEGVDYNELSISRNQDGSINILFGSEKINDFLQKGKLEALLNASEQITQGPLKDFRRLIATIVRDTNAQHELGYGLDGGTGRDFFGKLSVKSYDYSEGAKITSSYITSFQSLTLHEYQINFTSPTTYEVKDLDTNTVVTSGTYTSGSAIWFNGISVVIENDGAGPQTGDYFVVSPFENAIEDFSVDITDTDQIAAASDKSMLPGDNTNALQIIETYEQEVSELSGTKSDFYSSIVSDVGVLSSASQDSLKFEQNLMNELNSRREALSGVNLDEEAANLIRFQKSFEAASKLIQLTDQLTEEVLKLV